MRRFRLHPPQTRLQWALLLLMLVILSYGVMSAFAAANTVPETGADVNDVAMTANTLKPAACAGLTLTNLVEGSGTLNGTAGNDLILGSGGADTIDGSGGDDCIVAGGGDDGIDGGNDTDICIGGAGTDTFANCETQIDP
ncbi:MAG: hypothetical protein EPO32_00095 [Anaerolineae bacterium]|nr:MAG: hypothetical protein EPO32_00095 [Anaerolineae bacterium]